MKRFIRPMLVFMIGGLLLFADWQSPQTLSATEKKTTSAKGGTLTAKPGWEQRWEATVAAAKKEGVVSIYTMWVPRNKNNLAKAFKEKFGINLEFTLFSRGAELAAKAQTEARAGLYLVDVYGGPGSPPLILNLKPEGLLRPIEPLLILPEVLNLKAWVGGNFPFVDREGTVFCLIGSVMRNIVYNSDLIRDGEITSYKDLLKPQYKGKIILNDPSTAGGSNAALSHLAQTAWGEEGTANFLRKLIREQGVVILRDQRVHVEWLSRGKYAIGISPLREIVTEFAALGAPIKFARLREDNRISPSTGVLGVPAKIPHPNAATVFVNWLLTKEGASIFAEGFGGPSTRVDASTKGIDPLLIPVPGERYYGESEETMRARDKWFTISKKIMEESTK